MVVENRCWVMARYPDDDDLEAALELHALHLAKLKLGEVLVHNAYISMDAGIRMYMNPRKDSYGAPFEPGSQIVATVLGEVVESRHPDFRTGDLVRGYGQWADYSIFSPDERYAERVSWQMDDLRQHLGVFGANGWTAYLGVHEYGQTKSGETVVVSAAAGCTGALASQIAKAHGCRVIGIAGSDDKCRWLVQHLGLDGAVNYKTQDVEAVLGEICPQGVDVYFDNVAGPMLDSVIANMANYGRIALCGLIQNYKLTVPVPGPYKFDLVLSKRLKIIGFFSPDFYHRGPDINRLTAKLYHAGKLKLPFDITSGLDNCVQAYKRLFTGHNVGKVLVELHALKSA